LRSSPAALEMAPRTLVGLHYRTIYTGASHCATAAPKLANDGFWSIRGGLIGVLLLMPPGAVYNLTNQQQQR